MKAWQRRISTGLIVVLLCWLGPVNHSQAQAVDPSGAPTTAAAVHGPMALPPTTATSRTTFDQGTYTTRIYPAPVNYQDASGAWQPIDNTLVSSTQPGFAYENAGNSYHVRLPVSLNKGIAIENGGAQLTLALPTQTATGTAAGDSDSFSLDGTTIAYTAENSAVKETITLPSSSAPHRFAYTLRATPGLTFQQAADGSIAASDSAGAVPFTLLAPTMRDAAGATSSAVSLQLTGSGALKVLLVTPDTAWLSDPARQYPVVIDPTVVINGTGGANQECDIHAATPTQNSCASTDTDVEAGFDGTSAQRTLLQFDVASAIGKHALVENAELGLDLLSQTTSTAPTLNLYALTRSWTSSVTWNTSDGTSAWTTPGGDFSSTVAATRASVGAGGTGWYTWYPTQLVQNWVNGTTANNGMILKEPTENVTNVLAFADFYNSPSTSWPYLDIHWQSWMGELGYEPLIGWNLTDSADVRVNVANGNLILHQTDAEMPGIGLPLVLDRYMNNLAWGSVDIGGHWNMTLGNQVKLTFFNDGSAQYCDPTGACVPYIKNADGTFTTPPGMDNVLVKNGDGTYRLTDDRTRVKQNFTSSGYLSSVVDLNGNTISLAYNSGNHLTSITDTQGRTTSFTYGTYGISQMTDPAGRIYKYGYDTSADLTSYTDPLNANPTQYFYDANYDLDKIIDPKGNITTFGFDGGGRITSLTEVTNTSTLTGPTWTFTYNSGNTVVTDPNSHTSTYTYDALGRETAMTDAENHTWQTSWTSDNQVASETTPSGHLTQYTYDGLNNLTKVTMPTPAGQSSGPTLQWTYGNASFPYQATSFTDEEGHVTQYTYDATYGRLITVQDALSSNNQTHYAYNSNGTLQQVTDANSHITSYGYYSTGTATGLLQTITAPSPLGATTIQYDNANRVAQTTDGKGQTGTYTYDTLDRLLSTSYSDGTGQTHSYNAVGDELTRGDVSGGTTQTTTEVYDSLGRVTSETFPYGSHLGDGHSVEYTYDGADNLLTKVDPTGMTTYTYGANDETATVQDPINRLTSQQTSYTYDQDGQLTKVAYPNGVSENYTYDTIGQLTQIKALNSANATLNSYSYSFTDPGNSNKYTLNRFGITDVSGNTWTYGYDPLVRVTSAVEKNSGGSTLASYSYGYDPVDNMTSSSGPSGSQTMTYNSADELATLNGSSTGITFDANGNQTGGSSGTALAYNAQDQTTTITPPAPLGHGSGTPITMTYTGAGQSERIGNGTTNYVYDQTGVMSWGTSGQNPTYETNDPDGSMVSERVYNTSCTGSYCEYYYLYDGLGSVVGLVDSSGTVQDSYSYDPEGNLIGGTWPGPVPNIFGYAGAVWDSQTGLYEMGERYYYPQIGRFTQPDPLGGGYGYADDNPINETDPSGLCGFGEFEAPTACPGFEVEAAEEGAAYESLSWENQTSADYGAAGGETGKLPSSSWPSARARYWKAAARAKGALRKYGKDNLERMRRGLAPRRYNAKRGRWESMELHHKNPRHKGGSNDPRNLVEVWPCEHAAIDPYRHAKGC